MSGTELDKLVGGAWKAHRQGFQEKAIEQYEAVLAQNPQHFDALYGLGLAYKASGNVARAQAIFSQLHEALTGLSSEENSSGHPGQYFMLANMVRQQLKTLQK